VGGGNVRGEPERYYPGFGGTQYGSSVDSSLLFVESSGKSSELVDDVVPKFDFRTHLISPEWIKDDLVRDVVNPDKGFRINVDLSMKGHLPAPLKLDTPTKLSYFQGLIDAGIVKAGKGVWNHPHFFVDNHKPKPRLIFHGKRFKHACPKPPHFKVNSYATNVRSARRCAYGALFDFAHFYFNNYLHVDLQPYFGIHTSIGYFVWTRCPFGWSWSAYLAHSLAEQVVKFFRYDPERPIDISHYMDDCPVTGDTEEQVNSDMSYVIDRCDNELGVRVQHTKTVWATQSLKIIGVVYDYLNKTSAMSPCYWLSIRRAIARMKQGGVTRVNVAEVIGSLVFPNKAYPGSLSVLYDLLLFSAEIGDNWKRRLTCGEAKTFLVSAEKALDVFEVMPPCALQSSFSKPPLVYFDATPNQLGVVMGDQCFAEGIDLVHIFLAEAQGLDWANDISSDLHVLTFVTDNQPLFWGVRKGWSPNRAVNRIISKLLLRRLKGDVIFIKWVPSADNPADEPSRWVLTGDGSFEHTRLNYENLFNDISLISVN
jgi:hypothetical protein